MTKLTQKNIHKLGKGDWKPHPYRYKWYVKFPTALWDELEVYWEENPPLGHSISDGGDEHIHLHHPTREDAREFVRGFNRTQREIESKKEEVKVHPVFQKVLDLFGSNFQK